MESNIQVGAHVNIMNVITARTVKIVDDVMIGFLLQRVKKALALEGSAAVATGSSWSFLQGLSFDFNSRCEIGERCIFQTHSSTISPRVLKIRTYLVLQISNL